MNSQQKDGSFWKVFTINTLLLGFVLLVMGGIGELVVRALYQDKTIMFPRYHTDARYNDYTLRRLRPSSEFRHRSVDGEWSFITNSQGFRDVREYPYQKPEGVLRVLNLGDSHTQGFEVRQDHTLSKTLERALQHEQLDAEVFNMGISGFSTAEQLAFLENEGIKYNPDAVVIGFYANDFEDNIKASLFKLKDGELVVNSKSHTPGVKILNVINFFPPLRWLSENSYFYSMLLNNVWSNAKRFLLEHRLAEVKLEYAVKSEKTSDITKNLMAKLIKRMYRFCQQHEIQLVIVDIPQPHRNYDFKSSIPEDLVSVFRANSDLLILSEEVLDEYRGVAEFHLPHGHHHISEFSHLHLGQFTAEAMTSNTAISRK